MFSVIQSSELKVLLIIMYYLFFKVYICSNSPIHRQLLVSLVDFNIEQI